MRSSLLIAGFLICSNTWAQESSSTTTASTPSAATVSSADRKKIQPTRKALWGSENYTYENDLRNNGPLISYNFVGARFSPNAEWDFDLRQQFQYASSTGSLSGRTAQMHDGSSVALAETVLRAAYKPKGFLKSNTAILEARYYAPTDKAARENKELGQIRLDAWLDWALSSKLTIAGWLSPRVMLNSSENPNKSVGADAEYYQLRGAPYFMYTLNDHVVPYYAYNLIESFSQAQRGNWEPDLKNTGAHEAGLFLTYRAWLINPSIISETNLENGGGSILTSDSRAYSYENISYNLNVYATF